jgi:hypothetical protein
MLYFLKNYKKKKVIYLNMKIFFGVILAVFLISFIPCFSALELETQNIDSNNNSGTKYAIIIGIGEYESPPNRLYRPALIAQDIYDSLLGKDGWYESNMKLLTDQQATKSNIFQALEWAESVSTHEDIVVITFAGHGITIKDDNDGDERFDQAIVTQDENFITDDRLNMELVEINAKGFYIVIDSCYSGGFDDLGEYSIQDDVFNNHHMFKESFLNTMSGNNRVLFLTSLPFTATYSTLTIIDGRIAVTDGISRAIDEGKTSAEDISIFTRNWWYSHPKVIINMFTTLFMHVNPLFDLMQILSYIFKGQLITPFAVPHMIDNFPGDLQLI